MKWFKTRKRKELEEKNSRLLQKLSIAEKKINTLEKQVEGERITSPYCKTCYYAIPAQTICSFGEHITTYLCSLNCTCKDYTRKETNI